MPKRNSSHSMEFNTKTILLKCNVDIDFCEYSYNLDNVIIRFHSLIKVTTCFFSSIYRYYRTCAVTRRRYISEAISRIDEFIDFGMTAVDDRKLSCIAILSTQVFDNIGNNIFSFS